MKTSKVLILVLISTAFISCNQWTTRNSDKIVGVWQNIKNPHYHIEFTDSGEYYVSIDGKRITESLNPKDSALIQTLDSTIKGQDIKPTSVIRYVFDESNTGINLTIFDANHTLLNRIRLEFLYKNKIKLSLYDNNRIISESEFTRVE